MDKIRNIEIMAPVGSYESLSAAIAARADSIYFGVGQLNMRARSSANFSLDDLSRIVSICKDNGIKSYLTVNTILYQDELTDMRAVVDRAVDEGVDAVIAADQAAIAYARSRGMEVHISTQLNVSNLETVRFYSAFADVMVLARELTLPQVKQIYEGIEQENICGPSGSRVRIEMFAHGALCMAVSGRCYLSAHETGCSANRGSCRQLCRRSYILKDRDTGEEFASEGNYLLSPKDLCTIGILDRFIDAGVRVLKIEGRARPAEYVKTVCECYREAVAAVAEGTFDPGKVEEWKARLVRVFNRGFWEGYYLGEPTVRLSDAYGSSATVRKVYLGKVTNFFKRINVAEIAVEACPLEAGSDLLVTGETTGAEEFCAAEVHVEGNPVDAAPQGVRCSVKSPVMLRRGDRVFRIVDAGSVITQ